MTWRRCCVIRILTALSFVVLAAGCSTNMSRQPNYHRPLEPSRFFPDGRSSQGRVVGTVAHGDVRTDEALFAGKINGVPVDKIPVPVTAALLARGRERFNAICTPCHGYLGDGQGMVVQRGFSQPPSYHIERLREAPDGHFFDVITNGFGKMWSYAPRVEPQDRWAIAAYIRALQLSQGARLEDLSDDERQQLLGTKK